MQLLLILLIILLLVIIQLFLNIIDTRLRESEEGSISSVSQENVFKKVMTDNLFKEDDDRIEFLSTINYNLLHRINHLTYLFQIKKDLSESYNSRL